MPQNDKHKDNQTLPPEPPGLLKNLEWFRRHWREHWKLILLAIAIVSAVSLLPSVFTWFNPFPKDPQPPDQLVRTADELRRAFRTATENRKPPLSREAFRQVLRLISTMQQLDTNNGHAHYYSGEVNRWMGMHRESHEGFFRYLDFASTRPKGTETSVEECYGRADGYCRQRTGWIHHLIANDLYSEARSNPDGIAKLSLYESGLRHTKAALDWYPGGFIQHIPTKALAETLHREITDLKANSKSK